MTTPRWTRPVRRLTPAGSVRHDRAVTAEHRSWTLLTNHGRILLMLAREPDSRLRDLAEEAGITERSVQAIISDLEASGYVTKHRVGRRNSYRVNRRRPFRHTAESGHQVGELLDLFADE